MTVYFLNPVINLNKKVFKQQKYRYFHILVDSQNLVAVQRPINNIYITTKIKILEFLNPGHH